MGRIGGGDSSEVILSLLFWNNCISVVLVGYLLYYWLEVVEVFIMYVSDDLGGNISEIRGLLWDLVEVRVVKMRDLVEMLGVEG